MCEKVPDQDDLSLLSRVILRIPKLSLDGVSPIYQGLFWVLGLPIFFVCSFFLDFALLVSWQFPINYVSVALFNLMIALLVARVLIERELNLRRAILKQQGFQWNVGKTMEEYVQCLKRDGDDRGTEAQ
jgi:hypothetical protein